MKEQEYNLSLSVIEAFLSRLSKSETDELDRLLRPEIGAMYSWDQLEDDITSMLYAASFSDDIKTRPREYAKKILFRVGMAKDGKR